jgi:hypothetical protein
MTDDYRLQTKYHRPKTIDYRLQTTDYKLQTTDDRLQISDYRLQTVDHKPQITNEYRLQTTDYRSRCRSLKSHKMFFYIKLVVFLSIRIAGVQNKTGAYSLLSPSRPATLEHKWFETCLYCKQPPLPIRPHA